MVLDHVPPTNIDLLRNMFNLFARIHFSVELSDSYFSLISGLLSSVWQDFTAVITSVDDKVRLALVA